MRVLAVALAVALAAPAVAAPPAPSAQSKRVASAAAKHTCKKRRARHDRRRRCRRSKQPSGMTGTTLGGDGTTPARLLVTERELSPLQLQLQLSRSSVPAGTTIVDQYNAGQDPHNLVVEKGDGLLFSFPTLEPGANARHALSLDKGTWTLYCSLLDHRQLGMQATLIVN